jgi:hypothetical protein
MAHSYLQPFMAPKATCRNLQPPNPGQAFVCIRRPADLRVSARHQTGTRLATALANTPHGSSTWLLGLGNSQLPLGKHSQTAELKKANYSAPLRALANWRWKPGRRICRNPIGQPYAATPHDGIACIGTPLCIGMALIAVTSPRRSPRNNAGTAWSAAFHQVDWVGLGGTSPYGGWRVFIMAMSRPWRCSGRLK